MRYRYEIEGGAAGGQTWTTKGEIESASGFTSIPSVAMRASFEQLTDGLAVYGRPGLGCNGPYTVTRMLIEEKHDDLAP